MCVQRYACSETDESDSHPHEHNVMVGHCVCTFSWHTHRPCTRIQNSQRTQQNAALPQHETTWWGDGAGKRLLMACIHMHAHTCLSDPPLACASWDGEAVHSSTLLLPPLPTQRSTAQQRPYIVVLSSTAAATDDHHQHYHHHTPQDTRDKNECNKQDKVQQPRWLLCVCACAQVLVLESQESETPPAAATKSNPLPTITPSHVPPVPLVPPF